MLSGMKLDPEIAKSSHEVRHVFGQGRSMAPHQSVGSDKTFQFRHKNKLSHSLGQPYLDPNRELRQSAITRQLAHPNSSVSDQKLGLGHKSSDGDELIKHMSNLPGFLQQMEEEKSVQEKALNFGVLDWKRLEKWKYTERMPRRSPKKTSSASEPPKMGPSLKRHPRYSGNESWTHGSQYNSPQRQPPPPYSSHLKDARYVSYPMEEKFVGPVKFKDETCSQKFQAAKVSTVRRQEDHFHQRVQLCKRSCSKANVDNSRQMDRRKDVSLTEQSKHKFSLVPPIKALGKRNEKRYDDEMKLSTECCLAEPPNMVFLPKHFPKNGYSESSHFMESMAPLEGQLPKVVGSTLFDFFSTDVPHSCPLPCAATSHAEHETEPTSMAASHAIDLDIRSSAQSNANTATSKISKGVCSMIPEKTAKPSAVLEACNKTNVDIAEQPIVKGRAPSPTRRFSFSLGRLSRSGSFKDSAVPPQLSSTHSNVKSGQVRPEISSVTDNFERDKESAISKRQSSPLRRLLSPLLKYKGAQSAETAGPSNGSLRSMTARTPSIKGLSQDRKPEASFIQALLQLTMKNELPFFKLVVDNSENMLAAAVKRLPTPGKSDSCMIYTFYSVHEIRKKGMNWISQGSKSKSSSLGYNTIGLMKISTSHHLKGKAGDYGACDTNECVLYGVDPGKIDKQTLEFAPNKEIAAIIVKKPNAGVLSDANQLYKGTKFPHTVSIAQSGTEENKISKSMVVILPGGVHSTPSKGTPSSLISRWKSGGVCDCGGWDVGCKLRVLANDKSSSIFQASISSSDINRINLFIEGDEPKSKPVFSLEPLRNGLYSVDLDASISLLEAFATCVAYVTCAKFPEMIDMKVQSDTGCFPEGILRTDAMDTPVTFQDQLPVKYASCPPLSPAGRI